MAARTKSKPKPAAPVPVPVLAPAEVLTLAEAAAFLRVSDAGLRVDAEAARVPGRVVAGEWRFARAVLLDWLARPEPPAESRKKRMMAVIGAWKDDPTAEAMAAAIDRDRNRPFKTEGAE
ncbi:MAG: helix-turn-helix domain-containing protein [Fimbriiglobus sp.]